MDGIPYQLGQVRTETVTVLLLPLLVVGSEGAHMKAGERPNTDTRLNVEDCMDECALLRFLHLAVAANNKEAHQPWLT